MLCTRCLRGTLSAFTQPLKQAARPQIPSKIFQQTRYSTLPLTLTHLHPNTISQLLQRPLLPTIKTDRPSSTTSSPCDRSHIDDSATNFIPWTFGSTSARREARYVQPIPSRAEEETWLSFEIEDEEGACDTAEEAGEGEEYFESLKRKLGMGWRAFCGVVSFKRRSVGGIYRCMKRSKELDWNSERVCWL